MECDNAQNRRILGIIHNTIDVNENADIDVANDVNKNLKNEFFDDGDNENTKENNLTGSNTGNSQIIGSRVPPMKHPKNRPPKFVGEKPSMKNMEKKYIPVTSSGYGRISVSSTSRSSSVSSAQRLKSTHEKQIGTDAILRGAASILSSSSSSPKRLPSSSQSRRIRSAPSSPAKPTVDTKSSNSRPTSKSRIRSNSTLRSRNMNNSGSAAGSLWKQEQREIQRRRMQQQHKSKIPPKRTHRQTNSEQSSIHSEGLESPKKSLKTSQNSNPSSPKMESNSNKSTPNIISKITANKSAMGTPISSIKKVLRSISPKSGREKRSNNTTPILSPAHSWSRSVEISSIASDYFDRKKLTIATELASIDSPSSNPSDIKILAEQIFAPGTGLTDEEVRRVLNSKVPSTKQWDYKKKIDLSTSLIKKLRDSLNSFVQAKNRLVSAAAEKERNSKQTRNRVIRKAQLYEEENAVFKSKLHAIDAKHKKLTEQYKDNERELSHSKEKIEMLDKELESLMTKLRECENARTQAEINLAVAEGRCKEASKQADSWRIEIATLEASKSEAVKKIESSMERELIELREECAALRTKMESREEELGRLVNVNDCNEDSNQSQLAGVKRELDRLRERVNELNSLVNLKEKEIERLRSENEAVVSRYNSKQSDMSELMKGLSDIQKTGQEREEKANALRMAAEDKAAEMEVLLTEARGENSIMAHEKKTLQDNLNKCLADISSLEMTISALKEEIQSHKEQYNSTETNLQVEKELRARAEAKEKEERNERIALSAQMMAITKEHAQIEAHLRELNESQERQWQEKLDNANARSTKKDEEMLDMKETITSLEGERKSLMEALGTKESTADAKSVEEIGRLNGEINVLNRRLTESELRATSFGQLSAEQIKELQDQLREGQAERRKMHNIIQELRGNVRVFARIRPFLPGDGVNSDAEPCVVPRNDNSLKISSQGDSSSEHSFSFDRVFAPSIGQEAVFQEVSEFVQSALDGYNVCLFSYGQTGSGKTHTMQGSGVGQMRGIIPRAIEQVGKYKELLENDGWKYDMKVSFLEIYNEKIRDLLREKDSEELKHEIKVKNDGQRHITDLTIKSIQPSDHETVQEIMRTAAKHRSVASTDMNTVSSRSHSVFTLHLTATHIKQKQSLRGILNLVDLAGSERLDRSGAVGCRAKEAMSINKSLSSLTDVFTSIGKKASHVPFRNSKLTYLLQPSLSGDGKTLMIVNLSPTQMSFQESVCSLRFASQVNKCELGKPRRTIEDVESDNENTKMKRPIPRSPLKKVLPNKHGIQHNSPQKYLKRKKPRGNTG